MNEPDPLSTKNKIHLRTLVLLRMISFAGKSFLGATIVAFVLNALTIVVGMLASKESRLTQAFDNNTIPSVSEKYPVFLTPAKWAFSIWGLIYLLQIAWIGYLLVNQLFLKKELGFKINLWALYVYSLACVFNVLWVFLWLKERLLPCFVALLLMAKALHTVYTMVASGVNGDSTEVLDEGNEVYLIIFGMVFLELRMIFIKLGMIFY